MRNGSRYAELACVGVLCLYAVLMWLRTFGLSPDSTNFITASRNLVETGRLFVFANWPSRSMEPVVEPYTDYAPGLPLYLAPFILVLRSPLLAAAVAQAVAIVLFYAFLRAITVALGLRAPVRLGAALVFTLFATFSSVHGAFWTETLFIALSLGVGWCSLGILRGGRLGTYLPPCVALLFLSSLVKFTGILNLAWILPALAFSGSRPRLPGRAAALAAAAASAAAVLPVLLWMLRNRWLYGYTTRSHHAFEALHGASAWAPFRFAGDALLDCRLVPAVVVLIAVLALTAAPFLLQRGGRGVQALLLCAAGAHFLGVWLPSLFADFNALEDRLLSPAVAIGCLAVLHGLNGLVAYVKLRPARYALMALPFVFIALSRHVEVGNPLRHLGTIHFPREMRLWQRIEQTGIPRSCSHFYTDRDFNHQIFSGIPQRILWEPTTLDAQTVGRLMAAGRAPFFLLSWDSPERRRLERSVREARLPLTRIEFAEEGFALYCRPGRQAAPAAGTSRP